MIVKRAVSNGLNKIANIKDDKQEEGARTTGCSMASIKDQETAIEYCLYAAADELIHW